MPDRIDPPRNLLLRAVPPPVWARWCAELEPVRLASGELLYDVDRAPRHVHFPTTALVSLVYPMLNGEPAEIAVIGHEGLVGTTAFMGGSSTPSQAVVHSAGWALRLDAQSLRDDFERDDALRHLLLRYAQAIITQIALTAVCNRRHQLDARLCRWLLLSLDSPPGPELTMTHERLANMLGVRREGVTTAVAALQRQGLLHCTRGHMVVLSRAGLEQRACECYDVVRREYHRLLPEPQAN
ncbi:MAG: Crp/Fnr family transcriptional regulator [Burkholderiales bacterium]|nr:Crp/Fnr family transcriptional regulator [Burkholderiales bacterium]